MFGGGPLRDRPRELDWRSKRDGGGRRDPWRSVIGTLISLVVLLMALAVFSLCVPGEEQGGPGGPEPNTDVPEVRDAGRLAEVRVLSGGGVGGFVARIARRPELARPSQPRGIWCSYATEPRGKSSASWET